MKRTILLLLTISLILGVLSSCGYKAIYSTNKTSDTETVEITTTDETITEEISEEETTTGETITESIESEPDDTVTSDTKKNDGNHLLTPDDPEWWDEVYNPDNILGEPSP